MYKRIALAGTFIALGFLLLPVAEVFRPGNEVKAEPILVRNFIATSPTLIGEIAWFLVAYFALFAITSILFVWLFKPVAIRLARDFREKQQLVWLGYLGFVIWLILESARQYPFSKMGQFLDAFLQTPVGTALIFALSTAIGLVSVIGLVLRIQPLAQRLWNKQSYRYTAAGIIILLVAIPVLTAPHRTVYSEESSSRPNIIIISIDSWRADHMPGRNLPAGVMPFLTDIFREAAVFEQAFTPLARSFPAWWTVFTGQFPATHGVRMNLMDDSLIDTPPDLLDVLRNNNYYRLFAMDERRFANIREEHGFDKVVGPKLGASDLLLGTINDTPLTNLLANTLVAKWLFPFTYSNRAASFVYRPETFTKEVTNAIYAAPGKPLFLLAHHELPHWPYYFAERPTDKFSSHASDVDYSRYLETLSHVDLQIQSLFTALEQGGRLENAIIILTSDHGESFRSIPTTWERRDNNQQIQITFGHGSSTLGMAQHEIPLAFIGYGDFSFAPGRRKGRASLADIYPTLAELLGLQSTISFDGISLKSMLEQPEVDTPRRPIPIETGFTPLSMADGIIEPEQIVLEAASLYTVSEDGRLVFKPDEMKVVREDKNRAVIYDDWILTELGRNSPGLRLGHLPSRVIDLPEQQAIGPETLLFMIESYCRLFPEVNDVEACTTAP